MKIKFKPKLNFVLESRLIQEDRAGLLIRAMQDEKIKYLIEQKDSKDFEDRNLFIVFGHQKSLRNYSKYKNRMTVIDSNDEIEIGPHENLNFNSYEEIAEFLKKVLLIDKRSALQFKVKESEKIYDKVKVRIFLFINKN